VAVGTRDDAVFVRHKSVALAIAALLWLFAAAAPSVARTADEPSDRYYDPALGGVAPNEVENSFHEYGSFRSKKEIAQALVALGYEDIREIKYSFRKGHYRAIGFDAQGNRYRLSISAYSGRVMKREYLEGSQDRDYEYGYDREYYDRYY
jgi:hypothetical protein